MASCDRIFSVLFFYNSFTINTKRLFENSYTSEKSEILSILIRRCNEDPSPPYVYDVPFTVSALLSC
jgi:hypothetical protein